MLLIWASVFFVAAGVTLITTPLLRRLALSVDLVDKPGPRKSHLLPVPYLGGVAIAAGILTALVLVPGMGVQTGVIAVSAAVVGAVGLIDDDHQLGAKSRLVIELVAALAALAVGLRLNVTGVVVIDGCLTLVWIIGLTNAANLLDNMDGLAAGVAVSIAASTFLLSALGGRDRTATLASAVAGACLGFLFYNVHPARVFMGDAGSLLIGYLLGVITIAAARPPASAGGLAVPVMLAAVPVADTTTVVLARLRRRRSVAIGGKDHLSHRLVRQGLSPRTAVAALTAVSLSIGVLGAVAGHGDLPLAAAALGSALLLGPLLLVALPAKVYDQSATALPLRIRPGVVGVFVGAAAVIGVVCMQSGVAGQVVGFLSASASRGRVPASLAATRAPLEPSELPRTMALALIALGIGILGVVLGALIWERRHGVRPRTRIGARAVSADAVIDVRDEIAEATVPFPRASAGNEPARSERVPAAMAEDLTNP